MELSVLKSWILSHENVDKARFMAPCNRFSCLLLRLISDLSHLFVSAQSNRQFASNVLYAQNYLFQ